MKEGVYTYIAELALFVLIYHIRTINMKITKWTFVLLLAPFILQAQNESHTTQWSLGIGPSVASFVNADDDIMPGQINLGLGLAVSVNAKSGAFRARVTVGQDNFSIDEDHWSPTPDNADYFDNNLKLNNLKIGVGYMTQLGEKLELGGYLDYGRLLGSLDNYAYNNLKVISHNNISGQMTEVSASVVYNIATKVSLAFNVHYGLGTLEYRVDEVSLANESLVFIYNEDINQFGADLQLMFAF